MSINYNSDEFFKILQIQVKFKQLQLYWSGSQIVDNSIKIFNILEKRINMNDYGKFDEEVRKLFNKFNQYKENHSNDNKLFENFLKQMKENEKTELLEKNINSRMVLNDDYRTISFKESKSNSNFFQKISFFINKIITRFGKK